jgi:hypothetical protein
MCKQVRALSQGRGQSNPVRRLLTSCGDSGTFVELDFGTSANLDIYGPWKLLTSGAVCFSRGCFRLILLVSTRRKSPGRIRFCVIRVNDAFSRTRQIKHGASPCN